MSETYQCQACGEVTPDGRCICVTTQCDLCGTQVKVIGHTTKHYEPIDDVAAIKADNAALRKVLESCRDLIANAKYNESYQLLLNIIEQTLSKGIKNENDSRK